MQALPRGLHNLPKGLHRRLQLTLLHPVHRARRHACGIGKRPHRQARLGPNLPHQISRPHVVSICAYSLVIDFGLVAARSLTAARWQPGRTTCSPPMSWRRAAPHAGGSRQRTAASHHCLGARLRRGTRRPAPRRRPGRVGLASRLAPGVRAYVTTYGAGQVTARAATEIASGSVPRPCRGPARLGRGVMRLGAWRCGWRFRRGMRGRH